MKTNTTLRMKSLLAAAAILTAGAATAAQNFNRTHSWSTGNSSFGASASFNAYDNFTAPGVNLGSYAVNASGTVTGWVPGRTVTAAQGSGSVTVLSDGQGSVRGTLSALGNTLVTVNQSLPYSSQHYVKTWNGSGSMGFNIWFIPVTVNASYNASVDAWFRVDTSTTAGSWTGGWTMPEMKFQIGPVADIAATASVSSVIGGGFASLSAGADGSLRVGKAALTANARVYPQLSSFNWNGNIFSWVTGGLVDVSVTADTAGADGGISLWAQASMKWLGSKRVSATVASFSSGAASAQVLAPITRSWF